jgi:hypothetical protein
VRSNLGERCPLLSPRAPYLIVTKTREKGGKKTPEKEEQDNRKQKRKKKARS